MTHISLAHIMEAICGVLAFVYEVIFLPNIFLYLQVATSIFSLSYIKGKSFMGNFELVEKSVMEWDFALELIMKAALEALAALSRSSGTLKS